MVGEDFEDSFAASKLSCRMMTGSFSSEQKGLTK